MKFTDEPYHPRTPEESEEDSKEESKEPDDTDAIHKRARQEPEFGDYAQAVLEEIRNLQDGRVSSFTADDIFPRQVFQQNPPTVNASLPKPPLGLIATSMLTGIKQSKTQNQRYGEFLASTQGIEDGVCGSFFE